MYPVKYPKEVLDPQTCRGHLASMLLYPIFHSSGSHAIITGTELRLFLK
jgi:hypothetical protein